MADMMWTPRDLPRIAVFAAVARHASFTAAAQELGYTKSMVSAQVRQLEAKCGARLLDRTTRSVRLTSVGEAAAGAAEQMLAGARGLEAAVRERQQRPVGHLAIGAPHGLASTVASAVATLVRAHPGLTASIVADDGLQDLVEHRLDVTVRIGSPRDSAYVIRRLGESSVILVAARALGLPARARPSDVAGERWVGHSLIHAPPRWTFTGPRGEREAIRPAVCASANTMDAFRALLLDGAGIGAIPELHVAEELRHGLLTHVCAGWTRRPLAIFALLAGRRAPPHVEAFLAQLRRVLDAGT